MNLEKFCSKMLLKFGDGLSMPLTLTMDALQSPAMVSHWVGSPLSVLGVTTSLESVGCCPVQRGEDTWLLGLRGEGLLQGGRTFPGSRRDPRPVGLLASCVGRNHYVF